MYKILVHTKYIRKVWDKIVVWISAIPIYIFIKTVNFLSKFVLISYNALQHEVHKTMVKFCLEVYTMSVLKLNASVNGLK